jgi:hypothetical protein
VAPVLDLKVQNLMKGFQIGAMDVFRIRGQLIADYASYVGSFIHIRDERVRQHVQDRLSAAVLWPEPLIQLNPSFESGGSIDDLVSEGVLHGERWRIFRTDKSPTSEGRQLRLLRMADRGGYNLRPDDRHGLNVSPPDCLGGPREDQFRR